MVRLYEKKDGSKLILSVVNTGSKFSCFAVETPGVDAATVLENHGHHTVGVEKELSATLVMGEEYAKKWLRGEANIDECPCEDTEGVPE
jgi:hypothetical protein